MESACPYEGTAHRALCAVFLVGVDRRLLWAGKSLRGGILSGWGWAFPECPWSPRVVWGLGCLGRDRRGRGRRDSREPRTVRHGCNAPGGRVGSAAAGA